MTKLKLPLQKLKEFCELAKSIPSTSESISEYIKIEIDFEIVTMTKTGLGSFLIFKFDYKQDDISFIIQEKVINDFCSSTSEINVFFEFEDNGNHHKIKDSENKKCYERKFNDGGYKLKDFPSTNIDVEKLSFTRLEKPLIESINRARVFVGKDDLHPMYNHIFISQAKTGDYYINAFSNTTMYLDKLIGFKPPFLAISPRENPIITKFDYLEYNSETNFNIYRFGSSVYGFSKIDNAVPVDLSLPINAFKKDDYFVIQTNDLMKFCTSVKLYSNSTEKDKEDAKWTNSSFSVDFGECTLLFEMPIIGEEIRLVCDVSVVGKEFNFEFNQTILYEIIRGCFFGYNEVCISDSGMGVCLFSKNHENMIGFMKKYFKPQN